MACRDDVHVMFSLAVMPQTDVYVYVILPQIPITSAAVPRLSRTKMWCWIYQHSHTCQCNSRYTLYLMHMYCWLAHHFVNALFCMLNVLDLTTSTNYFVVEVSELVLAHLQTSQDNLHAVAWVIGEFDYRCIGQMTSWCRQDIVEEASIDEQLCRSKSCDYDKCNTHFLAATIYPIIHCAVWPLICAV